MSLKIKNPQNKIFLITSLEHFIIEPMMMFYGSNLRKE